MEEIKYDQSKSMAPPLPIEMTRNEDFDKNRRNLFYNYTGKLSEAWPGADSLCEGRIGLPGLECCGQECVYSGRPTRIVEDWRNGVEKNRNARLTLPFRMSRFSYSTGISTTFPPEFKDHPSLTEGLWNEAVIFPLLKVQSRYFMGIYLSRPQRLLEFAINITTGGAAYLCLGKCCTFIDYEYDDMLRKWQDAANDKLEQHDVLIKLQSNVRESLVKTYRRSGQHVYTYEYVVHSSHRWLAIAHGSRMSCEKLKRAPAMFFDMKIDPMTYLPSWRCSMGDSRDLQSFVLLPHKTIDNFADRFCVKLSFCCCVPLRGLGSVSLRLVREQKKFRESIADITEVSVAAVIIVAINSSGKRRKLLALADKLFVDVVIGASDDFSASTIIDSLKTTSNGEFVSKLEHFGLRGVSVEISQSSPLIALPPPPPSESSTSRSKSAVTATVVALISNPSITFASHNQILINHLTPIH